MLPHDEYQPAFNAEVDAQAFYIRHQLSSGVLLDAAQWLAAAAASLVEQDNAIVCRIEKTALAGIAAATGSAMQENYRLPVRIAALFVIYRVDGADLQLPLLIGGDFWIQIMDGR